MTVEDNNYQWIIQTLKSHQQAASMFKARVDELETLLAEAETPHDYFLIELPLEKEAKQKNISKKIRPEIL